MAASRSNAYINTPITLQYRFYQDNVLINAFQFQKFEIHKVNDNGLGSTVIQATSTGIVNVSTGVYQYTMNAVPDAGTYFDKVFIMPVSGGVVFTDINQFTVYDQSLDFSGMAPVALTDNCRIYGQIIKPDGTPQVGALVVANIATFPALYSGTTYSLTQYPIQTLTNQLGQFALDVPKNCALYFAIPDINFKKYIKTPATGSADLFSLTDFVVVGQSNADLSPSSEVW
jgi:hypothetical protein